MPISDAEAKRWQSDQAARVGRAVQARRQSLGMSVAQLADLTAKLGYPVHRVALGKIESNNRAGKVDLAELLVLAAALGVPGVELIYPPDIAEVDTLPDVKEFNYVAAQGFTQSKFYDVVSRMIDTADRFERQIGQVLRASQDRADAAESGSRIGTPAEIAVLAARSARRTGLELEALYNEINRAVWPGPIPYEGFRMAMDIVDDDDLTFPIEGGSDG